MADSRNGKPLLNGSGGKERACAAEQNIFEFSGIEFIQIVTAQRYRAAAAAGTAGMDILHSVVEDHAAAVFQPTAKGDTVFTGKLH